MSVYRHVRLQSGRNTLIGYVTNLRSLKVGDWLTLTNEGHGPEAVWEIKYISDVKRADVAGQQHTWDAERVRGDRSAKSYPGAGVSGILSRIPPAPNDEKRAA